jgi:hypothetical protein
MTAPKVKTFNTVCPCIPDEHYMLHVLLRIQGIDQMIQGKYYFVIHGARQSGKTTFINFH